jgi:hypothetical protein
MTKPIEIQTFEWNSRSFISKRVVLEHCGRLVVAQETKGRRQVEIYGVDDGLEMFAGYLGDVAADQPELAVAAVEALSFDAKVLR